jgi:Rrf2 family protein
MNREFRAIAFLSILAKENRLVAMPSVAETMGLPRASLDYLVAVLKKGGLVHTVSGTHGGHRLAKPPEKTSVADIISCFDDKGCKAEKAVLDYFSSHTLEDIVSYNEEHFSV